MIAVIMFVGIAMMTFIKPFLRIYVSKEYFIAWKYKYEKEYNSALRDLKLYAPKVLRHSEIGFKTKLSILLRTFFPITFIKRDNKKAKLAYEKDTME